MPRVIFYCLLSDHMPENLISEHQHFFSTVLLKGFLNKRIQNMFESIEILAHIEQLKQLNKKCN